MASPNTIAMNESIPKPTAVMVREGNPNNIRHMKLALKKYTRGNTRGKRNGKNRVEVTEESGGYGRVPPSDTK